MATIITTVCDRCGEPYEITEVDEYYFLTEHDGGSGKRIDLCQRCQDDLKAWVANEDKAVTETKPEPKAPPVYDSYRRMADDVREICDERGLAISYDPIMFTYTLIDMKHLNKDGSRYSVRIDCNDCRTYEDLIPKIVEFKNDVDDCYRMEDEI